MLRKNSRIVITILLVLASLLVAQGPLSAQSDNAAETNKELWLKWWEVEATHDYSQMDQFFAPNITRYSAATRAIMPDYSVTNLTEYEAFLQGTAAMFPDYYMDPVMVVAEGDTVAFYGNFIGTFAENGNRLNVPMMGFAKFKDGLVTKLWVEWDNTTWDSQMTAVEAPITSMADMVGVWGIVSIHLPYSLEYTADGEVILGYYGDYENLGTYAVQDGQLLAPATTSAPCDVTYNVFVTRDANETVQSLRFELVGEDCSASRADALDGKTLYPYVADK